jgi:hypothetical protein
MCKQHAHVPQHTSMADVTHPAPPGVSSARGRQRADKARCAGSLKSLHQHMQDLKRRVLSCAYKVRARACSRW